ncbi:hypothetical protein AAG906_003232 [Vitis piasezkii]
MSIGASLVGFHTSIRLVVSGLYLLQCKDGDNRIYPLAFGIALRNQYIKYFPCEAWCRTYHVGQNLKTKFKNPAIHKLFHDAAHAYRVSEFNFIFRQLEMIDPRAARYLMDIGVDRWARSYSTGKRYNIMTIRIVESLNVVLKNARDLPILQLVEELRNLLQKWFVTPDGELRSRYNMSATYLMEPINAKECNVKYAGISAQIEQMGLQGKEETQHRGKLELEGKWAEKIAEGVFLSELGHFLDLNKWRVSFAILRDFCPF